LGFQIKPIQADTLIVAKHPKKRESYCLGDSEVSKEIRKRATVDTMVTMPTMMDNVNPGLINP
jgi:hypothetical protein